MTTHAHSHSHPHADLDEESATGTRVRLLAKFLEAHFGRVELHMPDEGPAEGEEGESPSFLVSLDETDATIDLVTMVRQPNNRAVPADIG